MTDDLVRRGRRAVLAGVKWDDMTMSLAGAILAYKTARDVARAKWHRSFNWKEVKPDADTDEESGRVNCDR